MLDVEALYQLYHVMPGQYAQFFFLISCKNVNKSTFFTDLYNACVKRSMKCSVTILSGYFDTYRKNICSGVLTGIYGVKRALKPSFNLNHQRFQVLNVGTIEVEFV